MLILGLGSNLGNRLDNLSHAIDLLANSNIYINSISPIYESKALLPESAPASWNTPYFNMVAICSTNLPPKKLLKLVKDIENQLGRQTEHKKWSPREIDIDILAYDRIILNDEELTIPHKEMLNRPFVILPLADICPHWTYPKPGDSYAKTAYEIAKQLYNEYDMLNTTMTSYSLEYSSLRAANG